MLRKITTLLFIFPLLLGQLCCYMHAHRDSVGSTAGLATSHVHLIWDGSSQGHVHRGHRHGSHSHSHSGVSKPKSDSQNDVWGKAGSASADSGHAVFGWVAILVPASSWYDSGFSPGQDLEFNCKLQPEFDQGSFTVRPQFGKLFALSAALYLHHCSLRL
jgi:hypothetical protein